MFETKRFYVPTQTRVSELDITEDKDKSAIATTMEIVEFLLLLI